MRKALPFLLTTTNRGDTVKNKAVLLQVLRIFLCELVCIAVMLAVYYFINKLSPAVWLGALAGGLVAIGNFFFLSIAVSRAADRAEAGGKEAAVKATVSVQRNSVLRKIVLIVIYIILLKSGYFDLPATVLPLVFVQVSIYVTEFFRKGGAKTK